MKIGHQAMVFGAVLFGAAAFGCSSSSSSGSNDAGSGGSSGSPATGGTSGSGGTASGGGGTGGSGGTSGSSSGGTSGSSGSGGTDGGSSSCAPKTGTPSITITSPTANATISSATDSAFPDLPVSFTVTNFSLETKAQQGFSVCPKGSCGHVHMFAHEPGKPQGECNDVPDGLGSLYNAAAFGAAQCDTSATQDMGLDYCPTIPGTRIIVLELHNDDHSPVKDSSGNVVSATVTVNVVESDGGAPDGGTPDAGTDGGSH